MPVPGAGQRLGSRMEPVGWQHQVLDEEVTAGLGVGRERGSKVYTHMSICARGEQLSPPQTPLLSWSPGVCIPSPLL